MAYLLIESTEFIPITTDVGKITKSIKNIQPYANASKILLVLRKPILATFSYLWF